jgi:phage tail sheath protein FI
MATTYKTPGVYINEIATLPASVAQVETAIPAFVGFTEKAESINGDDLTNTPKRIKSMIEFEQFFGGAATPVGSYGSGTSTQPKIILDQLNNYVVSDVEILMKYHLYYSMRAYFANGGGPCYIVSVGDYDYSRTNTVINTALENGIDSLEIEDEPTILLSPDATVLSVTQLGNLQIRMLAQCNKLQDRFTVMDLIEDASSDDIGESDFRTKVGTQYLKYGAAYGPWLETTFPFDVQYSDLNIVDKLDVSVIPPTLNTAAVADITIAADAMADIQVLIDADYLGVFDAAYVGTVTKTKFKNKVIGSLIALGNGMQDLMDHLNTDIQTKVKEKVIITTGELYTIIRQASAWDKGYPGGALDAFAAAPFNGTGLTYPSGTTSANFNYDLGTTVLDATVYSGLTGIAAIESATPFFRKLLVEALDLLDEIRVETERVFALLETTLETADPIYAAIKRAIAAKGVVIPSSGAVAGVYAAVDANRGVWKAPANVSLSNVVKPTIKVDNKTQEDLNVHTTGKSVNIIRSFTGKGILVWGARTLAGNDNEWRYVPVRRLFITMEESIKKATEFVVFEPNDANTWLRTKTMIENYLSGLWRQGALAGAKPADAFFVNVGLGSTMTAQDILEGKLIIEIGVAAVRPAEFIILRFSHKLQES